MPRKPKRPCRYSDCPNLTDRKSGYCEKHEKPMQRHYERFARGYKQHERYGSVWRKIRDRHLMRKPLCEMCRKRGRFVAATLVHHIKPLGDGGTHDESNLMSLCVSCHEKIHQRRCLAPGEVKSPKPRHCWTGDGSRAKKERFKRGIKETR